MSISPSQLSLSVLAGAMAEAMHGAGMRLSSSVDDRGVPFITTRGDDKLIALDEMVLRLLAMNVGAGMGELTRMEAEAAANAASTDPANEASADPERPTEPAAPAPPAHEPPPAAPEGDAPCAS